MSLLALMDSPKSSPEKNLLASIVERAIFDVKSRDPEDRASAYRWLVSGDTHRWSCRWVLEQLDLTPGISLLRSRVEELRERVALRDLREGTDDLGDHKPGKFNNIFLV